MSRIGKQPILITNESSVAVSDGVVTVKGPKGERSISIPKELTVAVEGNLVTVGRRSEDRAIRALHGFFRSELNNAIIGVTMFWTKELELAGVGYRAVMSGPEVALTVGFSHAVTITPPAGITLSVREGKIVVSGIDKRLVGEVAASIRVVKKPEPYKGKGIKYVGEHVRRKAGKSAKAVGGAPGAK
ncbi:50S ribosomal protein L6 [Candidatus Gottesmanbacteria bacterium]|nr:50S ribosomal protein L6 [Candidatus Gottesmanbacteria bacterium]